MRVSDHAAFFGLADEVVDDTMGCSQLPDLRLHNFLQHILLVMDQASLFLVVLNAYLIAPVATPPLPPCMSPGRSAILALIETLLTHSCAFYTSAGAAATITDDGEDAAAAKNA